MNLQYRIYFDDRLLLITGNEEAIPNAKIQVHNTDEDILTAIRDLDKKQVNSLVLLTENPTATFEIFKSKFEFIAAGGGLVKNENEEFLFIYRRGKWDLPKGKLDEGETIDACALREVQEETGIQHVAIENHLINTWHVYLERGRFILKESVWYNMQTSSAEQLTPQLEEGIMEIKWLAKNEWPSIFDNTFPSIKDVLRAAS